MESEVIEKIVTEEGKAIAPAPKPTSIKATSSEATIIPKDKFGGPQDH